MNPPIIITVECAGTAGQYLPSNAKVSDHEGSVYEHVGEIKLFPEDGHSIVLPFVSHHPHPINLPGEVAIYEACPGWDFAKLISADWPDSVRPRRKLIIPTQQRKYPGFGPPEVSKAAMSIINKRSEEHTSELQSLRHLVCRLLLEKNKKK